MDAEQIIADKLRPVGFDLSQLSPSDRAEVHLLALKAGIELPRANVKWGCHRDAEDHGFKPTAAPGFPLRPR